MAQNGSAGKKRLGLTIVALFIGAIILTVAVAMTVTLVMFKSYNDSILVERAHVGLSVLKDTLDREIRMLNDDYWMWSEDTPFADAINKGNVEYFEESWQEYIDSESDFCAIVSESGDVIFSANFPFKSFDFASVANGKEINGIVVQDDKMAAMYAAPATENGAKGALILGFDLEKDEWLNKVKNSTECDTTIFKGNLRYSTTLGANLIGTPMSDAVKAAVIDGKKNYEGQANINGKPYYVSYEPMYDVNNNVVGAYFAGSDTTDATNEFTKVTLVSTLMALIFVVASGVVIFIFTKKRVIVPIQKVTVLADEMERGELSNTAVDYWFVNDEVGTFARKLRYSKKSLSDCIADISGILNKMADGDFTETPNVTYPGDFETIKTSMLKIEEDLGQTLSRMSISSDEVLSGSNQMAEGSQSLADGTTKQASAIEEISATIQEVSTQIANTAEHAQRAGSLSKQTEEKVDYQDGEIRNMVEAMNEISNTSKEIEKIIKAIEDISFQTNILALNAAVEAARAGDAGKGFAVVADEVRNLANKSAEAAQSTSSLITASIEAVDKGAKLAFSTAESMKEVKQMSTETAQLISEIAEASAEQNDAIKQITAGVDQISQVIQMNSATAEETAASCEELSGQSRILKDQVARFRIND
jgi:methyl-accepting chemotaxis protein